MAHDASVELPILKRRRGTVKASLTRLTTKITELTDADSSDLTTINQAQQYLKRLETLDTNFKTHHLAIMDIVDDEGELGREQEALDQHDDHIMELSLRLQNLSSATRMTPAPSEARSGPDRPILERLVAQTQSRILAVSGEVSALTGDPSELHLAYLHQEQITDLKRELSTLRNEIIALTVDASDSLIVAVQEQDRQIFDMSVHVKKILYNPSLTIPPTGLAGTHTPKAKGVRLPQIDAPVFNGDLLQWGTFWEQFRIAVDNRKDISDAEKLVYLRHALKDGVAKTMVEGLSHTGDQYKEAIESLKMRYNRPRLIHQAHVKQICEVPSLKDGSGSELRKLHDTVQQHLRALNAMDHDPPGSFITSLLELKLDSTTMFEWQKASQDTSDDIPHYSKLLEFLNLRAQASEMCSHEAKRHTRSEIRKPPVRNVPSFQSSTMSKIPNCSICKTQSHPLYVCPQFRSLPHDKMLIAVRSNSLCLNCLRPGHFSKDCGSSNRCKKCQKLHHTLLHIENKAYKGQEDAVQQPQSESDKLNSHLAIVPTVSSNAQPNSSGNALLMTCQFFVVAPNGSYILARGLLDSGSSASFVSERLAQNLGLTRSTRKIRISGIAGISHSSSLHSITTLDISPTHSPKEKLQLSAIVVPRVTCDLPTRPLNLSPEWSHLSNLHLADPDFGRPSRIDILLGVDVYAEVLLQGRRSGSPGSPTAFETKFGWVLAGKTEELTTSSNITSHHVTTLSGDDLLRSFWEMEESPSKATNLSPEERIVVDHFTKNQTRTASGRFAVPLPKKASTKPLGESRQSAVRRFLSLERSLHAKAQFGEFAAVMQDYMEMEHAEPVPTLDLQKPSEEVFYLPMHAVRKEDSTTTKLRIVFDASAKSRTGISLNDTLLVGPTVHPPLLDILLRFRTHRVAVTTDVSKMYRAVELVPGDRDLHRFVWRRSPNEPLVDYRMTRLTFGVSASSFAANMSVKQNALDNATSYPLAAQAVHDSFYVDDGLTGAESVAEAIELQQQLQTLFSLGGFLLRKWNSSDLRVIESLPQSLRDTRPDQSMPTAEQYTKTLGIQWNASEDHFKLAVPGPPPNKIMSKRNLISDIAKTFDVLGWFAPATIKVKILMQQLWERKLDWDDDVPTDVQKTWSHWRSELTLLSQKQIPRCYFDKQSQVSTVELHGFSDASEVAYAAVVYLRATNESGNTCISLVISKTKVAPIKRLTIPRLELCGAQLLARLMHYVKEVLAIPFSRVCAWTDSTIVLNWLDGSPRRFKTYVGNRVSSILELISPDKWRHINGLENPADCASRGVFPSELLAHSLWWNGPPWLKESPEHWPKKLSLTPNQPEVEEKEISLHSSAQQILPIVLPERFSSFTKLRGITAWVIRFQTNCRQRNKVDRLMSSLSADELRVAENYWLKFAQQTHFRKEKLALEFDKPIHSSSPLRSLSPILDESGMLRVGGRTQLSQASYERKHPVILDGKDVVTHLIIRDEHIRLLHAGTTLTATSLYKRYHIVGGRKTVRSVTRKCLICRRYAARPNSQLLGQLSPDRITPGPIFDKVGVDYAGPVFIKYGYVRKPTVVKAYICIFVSLTVKAVHLELVTDLTSDSFIACLRRFISRRGHPTLIWSDNGTNFVGAARELKELTEFLNKKGNQDGIGRFLANQGINWKFIPQRSPNFGGLWEAAVKSVKYHIRRVLHEVKLTYEEYSTLLSQIEACLNSRPLSAITEDPDTIEALTPGHFLIGRPLEALPDKNEITPLSLLKRWNLCQRLLSHFWTRWSTEYVTQLSRFTKWTKPTRNL